MVTPDVIRKKDFTRGVRGYKEEEVDQFLDVIAVDLEGILRENAALKNQVQAYMREAERLRGSEGAVLGTLEAAKALMADIGASAEKRADIVLKNAELDAERIRQEAKSSIENMTAEAVSLSRRWELFSARFRNLLETELDRFDSFSAGLLLDETLSANTNAVGVKPARSQKPAGAADPGKTFRSSK